MGRQFNGTSDYLASASALAYSSAQKMAISYWSYWDTFANDDKELLTSGNFANTGWYQLSPNASASSAYAIAIYNGSGYTIRTFVRPSAATWHHYVVNIDGTDAANFCIPSVYVDGVSKALTNSSSGATSFTVGNLILYLMSSDTPGGFGAGQLADFAIYTGLNLSSTDASTLYGGTLPGSVQSGNLIYYWKCCGDNSPETPSVGSVNLTVNGTTKVSHPTPVLSSCAAPAPDQFVKVSLRAAP